MKKLISLLLVLVLVVAMAVPVLAMSSTTQTRVTDGEYPYLGTNYAYYCKLTANTAQTYSYMTFKRTGVNISTALTVTYKDTAGNTGMANVGDTSNLSVSYTYNPKAGRTITSVSCDYLIHSNRVATLTVY